MKYIVKATVDLFPQASKVDDKPYLTDHMYSDAIQPGSYHTGRPAENGTLLRPSYIPVIYDML